MKTVEIITLIIGITIIGTLSAIYFFYKFRKMRITQFIVKGGKEIKRLHYVLKYYKFQLINVNKTVKYKVLINHAETKYDFNVIAIAKRRKKKYIVFLDQEELDFEMLFKTKLLKYDRGLIIDSDTFSIKEFIIK